MGRRSDHTRSELRELMLEEGHRQLAEVGLARFSARDVAKQIGYSVGTLYNVFGSYDELMLAINARTLSLWLTHLRTRLAESEDDDRIATLVRGYFEFAEQHRQTWVAIYEYNLSDGRAAPEWYQTTVAELMGVVAAEIAAALPGAAPDDVASLARSLVATVHGHCVFSLYRTFNLLGETQPVEAALARVREALAAAQA
jgi:AcrR family transcriptional regulator